MTSLNYLNTHLWTYFKGACPVCNGAKRDCRQSPSGLIHCRDETANPIGYIFRGVDAWGFGLWAARQNAEAYSEEKRQEYQQERKRQREIAQRQLQEQRARGLSPEQRDRQIRGILAQLPLAEDHRENLRRRGFPDEQIHQGGYRTVEQWQKLPHPVSDRLAGVKLGGYSLLTPSRGILCPIPDLKGRFVAWQLRRDGVSDDIPKYQWAAGENARGDHKPTSHCQDGELPAGVYLANPELLQLCEGTSIKPHLASILTGYDTIGAASANFVGSEASASKQVQELAQIRKPQKIRLLADAGVLRNRCILSAYRRAIKFCQGLGYPVTIGWWGQTEKESGDIDELTPAQISQIQDLSPEEFDQIARIEQRQDFDPLELPRNPLKFSDWDIVASAINSLPPTLADDTKAWLIVGSGLKAVDPIRGLEVWINWTKQRTTFTPGNCRQKWRSLWHDGRRIGALCNLATQHGWQHPRGNLPLEEWIQYKEEIEFENWLQLRKYTPDVIIDEEFVGQSAVAQQLMESETDTILKAGLGQGKTTGCQQIIRSRYLKQKVRADFIGSLNNLLIQTGHKVSDPANGIHFRHLRSEDAYGEIGGEANLLYCIDSILCFSDYHYFNRDIYVDEINQFCRHTVEGGTLGSQQTEAQVMFEIASRSCRTIKAFDGNARDIEAELFERLTGREFTKILNQRKPPPKHIYFVDGVDEKYIPDYNDSNGRELTKAQIEAIAKENIKKAEKSAMLQLMLAPTSRPFVTVDSLKRSQVYYEMLTMQGKRGYVLNSETSTEDWARLFLANPSEFIEARKPDFMIISPSLQSGGDLHAHHWFTAQFSFFCGVLGTDGQTQQLFRLRDPVDIYISCPERGLPSPRYLPKSYNPAEVKQQALEAVWLDARLIGDQDRNVENHENLKRLAKNFVEQGQDDPWFDYWTQLVAISNYERNNLRKCLEYTLREAGHQVESVVKVAANQLKHWESDVNAQVESDEAGGIYYSRYLDDEEYERLKREDHVSVPERRAMEKHYLLAKLPGLNLTNYWQADGEHFILEHFVRDKDWLSSLERFYLLQHPEIAQKRQDKTWLQRLNSSIGREFYGRILGNPYLTIWALNQLGIMRLIGEEVNKNHPIVQDIFEKGQNPEIILALGIEAGKAEKHDKHIMEYIKRLAELAGIPLKAKRKRDENGKVLRVYSLDWEKWNEPARIEALAAINRRWEQWERETVIDWTELLEKNDGVTVESEEMSESFSQEILEGKRQQQHEGEAGDEDDFEFLPLNAYQVGDRVWGRYLQGEWLEGTVIELNYRNLGRILVRLDNGVERYYDDPAWLLVPE